MYDMEITSMTVKEPLSVTFENPATEAKIRIFLFAPKDPFGELFSKIIFKSSSELFFGKN